jgi:hypothetical protein
MKSAPIHQFYLTYFRVFHCQSLICLDAKSRGRSTLTCDHAYVAHLYPDKHACLLHRHRLDANRSNRSASISRVAVTKKGVAVTSIISSKRSSF